MILSYRDPSIVIRIVSWDPRQYPALVWLFLSPHKLRNASVSPYRHCRRNSPCHLFSLHLGQSFSLYIVRTWTSRIWFSWIPENSPRYTQIQSCPTHTHSIQNKINQNHRNVSCVVRLAFLNPVLLDSRFENNDKGVNGQGQPWTNGVFRAWPIHQS